MKKKFFILFIVACVYISNACAAEEILTWEKCVQATQENHPDLVSAQEQLNQAIANKSIIGSDLLPQITTGVSRKRTETNRVITNSYQYDVTAQQLVFDGFKILYDVIAADKTARSKLYNQAVISSDVRLRLRTAFVELLKAQALLEIVKDIAQRRKQNVELLQLRYDVGKEHKGSLLTVKADLRFAEFEVAQAQRDLAVAQRRLNKELGRTALKPLKAEGEFIITYADTEKPAFESLVESTPFLKDLVAKKESAKFEVKSAQADFFPQVFLTGSYAKTKEKWPPDRRAWYVEGKVSFPLFEGNSRFAELSRAKSAYRQALADEKSGRDGVILTMEEKWAQLQDAIDYVEVQRQFLEATEEREKIAQSQYSNGLILFDNWIIIEDDLVAAKKAFLSAQANALLAEAEWIQAKGGTLGYDDVYKK